MSEQLSVAKDIEALALINIQDIFRFTITATDEEIEDRYGSEARAIEIAEKYLEIAMRASVLEYDLKGWSMKYSVPIKGKNERIEKTAYFYDMADRKTENSSEKPNNCECEPRKEQNFCGKCRYLYRDFKYGLSCYRLMDNEPCKYEERKDEPTSSEMEQVDEPQTQLTARCLNCNNAKACKEKHWESCLYEPKDEKTFHLPQPQLPFLI